MIEIGDGVVVKVCGITNTNDALCCAAADVDMLGLNFSPQSSRCISTTTGAEIIAPVRRQFPRTKFVGVFVNQEFESVNRMTTNLALDAVQLHGEESSAYVRNLNAPFVIKALRVGPDYSTSAAGEYQCDAVLLDSWSLQSPGGTGKTFAWSVAIATRPRVHRLILAGGLTPENVADAIRQVRPWAVDVCSGVEDSPGRKNDAKVRRFLKSVRATAQIEGKS
ncbi:MAG: phosphoribosylanthranilate isomerase [Verrucomicrobiota bacterium]